MIIVIVDVDVVVFVVVVVVIVVVVVVVDVDVVVQAAGEDGPVRQQDGHRQEGGRDQEDERVQQLLVYCIYYNVADPDRFDKDRDPTFYVDTDSDLQLFRKSF